MIKITQENYEDLNDSYGGICLACKAQVFGVEPDARKYKCESCDEFQVYGVEELLIMGQIVFVDEEEEEDIDDDYEEDEDHDDDEEEEDDFNEAYIRKHNL